ncbi:hypothetical protein AB0M87_24010 [Streptomyces sp. NPDC051320]|uniref:hypothetical protein n=1 Tax=Streptomyces sp. NPDC051320 TaxID=3154644 RepID=UPI00343DC037
MPNALRKARMGTAAGVTLGLAVSIGGLIAPALGAAAEAYGPQGDFSMLCAIPAAALAPGAFLTAP